MTFEMNRETYKIVEMTQEEIRKKIEERARLELDDHVTTGRYFGITCTDTGLIVLDKDLPYRKQRKTLMHELMHAYIDAYITKTDDFNQEALCDISANSHDIIHGIVELYYEKRGYGND